MTHTQIEMLMEIQGICIGAESPDATEAEKNDPQTELKNCKLDLRAISKIVEKLLSSEGVK